MSRVLVQPNWRQAFDVTATLILVACGVGLWWRVVWPPVHEPPLAPSIAVPQETIRVGRSPAAGSRTAGVAIIEYSDFECPFCKRFARDVRGRIFSEFVDTGKVLFVFRHLPLDMHKHAVPAAIVAECAHRQGQFWRAHDIIFSASPQSAAVDVQAQDQRLSLNVAAFGGCLTSSEPLNAVQADRREAGKLGIVGTPGFLLGALQNGDEVRVKATIAGAKPYDEFRAAIEGLLR